MRILQEQSLSGFLISRHWFDSTRTNGRQSLLLTYWITTSEGPVKLEFQNERPLFFVHTEDLESLMKCFQSNRSPIQVESRSLDLQSFSYKPVNALYFQNLSSYYNALRILEQTQYPFFEADISASHRFLMERFITGSLSVSGNIKQRAFHKSIVNPKIKKASVSPCFTLCSFDIETTMRAERLYSIGLIICHSEDFQTTFRKVLMIGSAPKIPNKHQPSVDIEYFDSESALLHAFNEHIFAQDPDIFIGWNVINFDLKVLQDTADRLKIPLQIGREKTKINWRKSRGDNDHYTVSIPGRAVLDGIDTLRSATYQFDSFSLQHVSQTLLNDGKTIHSDDRGQEITDLFHHDKIALAEYNIHDCQLVIDIFKQTQLIEFAVERAELTGLALDRIGGSVASFDNRYLPLLHRSGFVAPNNTLNENDLGSPGGFVMDSLPGIYKHVLVLDFKSLYPSIIRTFKIDPLGLRLGLQQEPHDAVRDQKETQTKNTTSLIPGFNGAIFDKSISILPSLISELWSARDNAKKNKNAPMSQAIKILMNSFYGVLGTGGCRFFDYRLPSSITLRGHAILQKTKQLIEEKGYQVIYGDTDSVFVHLKGFHLNIDQEELNVIGQQLVSELNSWWSDYLKDTYGIESFLELEFETQFKQFIMPTIRGSEKGSKKRYAGQVIDKDGHEKIIFKGLESVRSDWTMLAKQFQQQLYARVFNQQDFSEFINNTVDRLYRGEMDELLTYRKRIRRQVHDYIKNVPPHIQAAKKGLAIQTERNLNITFKKGSWVEYCLTFNGPEPVPFVQSKINYDLYVEKQLKPIADSILNFLGTSFEVITSKQTDLFNL